MAENSDDKYAKARSVTEGKAKVLLPPTVFYNPVQEFNRDLTIAIIKQYSREHMGSSRRVNPSAKDSESSNAAKLSSTDEQSTNDELRDNLMTGDDHIRNALVSSKTFESEEATTNCFTKKQGLRILEALAASGLRSIRFALEVSGVKEIVSNDYDRTAVEYIMKNAEVNNVTEIVTPSCSDASILMYQSRAHLSRFHVVDLDPYGSPTPFLDAAVQCVQDGGLLCVTCTDMAVLCGNATETCHAKYGSTSLHAKFCHEMALRILLRCIDSHANRYSRYIIPLLSVSVDFYCRVFVRVHYGQAKVKDSAAKLAHVYYCVGCGAFTLQPIVTKAPSSTGKLTYTVAHSPTVEARCTQCSSRHAIAGPIWSAPLHDFEFVQRLIESIRQKNPAGDETQAAGTTEGGVEGLGTLSRILGMLTVVTEELVDVPLYYDMDDLCRIVHCTAVGFLPIRSAVINAGYKVSLSHASKKSLKTNAPAHVIWDIIRCWVRTHPVSADRLHDGSVAKNILSKSPTFEANFSIHPDANPVSRQQGLVRWQLNPESDWGPKARPTRKTLADESAEMNGRLNEIEDSGSKRNGKRKAEKNFKKFACKKFQRGECELGQDCRYSHSSSQLNLNRNNTEMNPTTTTNLTKI